MSNKLNIQKGNILAFLLIGILVLFAVAGEAFYLGKQTNKSSAQSNVSTTPLSNSTTPETVVSSFYNGWLSCEKEFNKYVLQDGPIPQDVSRKREECIKKAMVDYTVIQTEHPTDSTMWCAQDFPQKVTTDKAEISGKTAIVLSHHAFEYSGDNQIKVTLTSINNQWKISDTTCLRLNSPSTDETANWKTYTNEKFQYSMKIPSDWQGDWKLELTPEYVAFSAPFDERLKIGQPGDGIGITVKSVDQALTPLQYIDTVVTKDCRQDLKKLLTFKTLKIDSHDAAEYYGSCQEVVGHFIGRTIFIKNNDQVINVWAVSSTDTNEEILKSAIATFKFL